MTKSHQARSEAAAFCAEVDKLAAEDDRKGAEIAELSCRVQELALERDELLLECGELRSKLVMARADADNAAETIGLLLTERDDLADRLRSLNAAHQITIGILAAVREERDTYKAQQTTGGPS